MAPEESESRLRTRGWHRAQAQQHLEGSHGQAGGTREPLPGVANKGAPQKSFCPQHSAQQRAGPQLTGGSVRRFTEAGKHSHVQSVPAWRGQVTALSISSRPRGTAGAQLQ